MYLARRLAARYCRLRGAAAIEACRAIQRMFRANRARQSALTQTCRTRERKEQLRKERDCKVAQTAKSRVNACTVIQATCRGAIGRKEGHARARQKLKGVLVDLGGGLGRMHRYVYRYGRT